jgi:PAS domain S-box-containing protein
MDDARELDRLLFDSSPDAIIFADPEGIIRRWNTAAEALFGHSADDALGETLDLIVPERFREAHWQGFHRALEAGETKYRGSSLPTRTTHKDGSTMYVELTFAIVSGPEGSVIGALAHARDITQRWAEEREQRERMRQIEERLAAFQADDPG